MFLCFNLLAIYNLKIELYSFFKNKSSIEYLVVNKYEKDGGFYIDGKDRFDDITDFRYGTLNVDFYNKININDTLVSKTHVMNCGTLIFVTFINIVCSLICGFGLSYLLGYHYLHFVKRFRQNKYVVKG